MGDEDVVRLCDIMKLKVALHQPGLLQPGIVKNRDAVGPEPEGCRTLTAVSRAPRIGGWEAFLTEKFQRW